MPREVPRGMPRATDTGGCHVRPRQPTRGRPRATDTWRATWNMLMCSAASSSLRSRRCGTACSTCCAAACVLHYGAGSIGMACRCVGLVDCAHQLGEGEPAVERHPLVATQANQRCNVCIGSAKGDHAVALPCAQANGVGAGAVQWRWVGGEGVRVLNAGGCQSGALSGRKGNEMEAERESGRGGGGRGERSGLEARKYDRNVVGALKVENLQLRCRGSSGLGRHCLGDAAKQADHLLYI